MSGQLITPEHALWVLAEMQRAAKHDRNWHILRGDESGAEVYEHDRAALQMARDAIRACAGGYPVECTGCGRLGVDCSGCKYSPGLIGCYQPSAESEGDDE